MQPRKSAHSRFLAIGGLPGSKTYPTVKPGMAGWYQFNEAFTSIAIVSKVENNIFTCKCFI